MSIGMALKMLEHLRDWRGLLERVARWLREDGRLFIHVFCQPSRAYPFGGEGDDNWMAPAHAAIVSRQLRRIFNFRAHAIDAQFPFLQPARQGQEGGRVMTLNFPKMYAVGVVTCFAIDLLWLGVVAKGFYQRQIGHLMRPDVQWVPAVLFYLIYVAALVVFVAGPAVERQSVGRAIGYGAFFGLAAYAAFDLTGLALLKEFPVTAALTDLAWGAFLSATVSAVVVLSARAWS